jgi:Transglycosylase SLT domain
VDPQAFDDGGDFALAAGEGGADRFEAAPAISRAERMDAQVPGYGDDAIEPLRQAFGGLAKPGKEFGFHAGHVTRNNQIPGGAGGGEGGFDARERSGFRNAVRDDGKSEAVVNAGISDQRHRTGGGGNGFGGAAEQSASGISQEGFVAAHPGAFSARQNEARPIHSTTFIQAMMIPLRYVKIRQAHAYAGLCLAVCSTGLRAETVVTRTSIVVRADARSGRLVRSVVVTPKVVSTAATKPEPLPAASQAFASGSLTEMIDAIAARNNVEPSLVHSVIKAESNYNPLALSPKGAQGLMQLIPSTARRFGVANSFNAQENIEGGVKYLKFLMDLYQNDYPRVIAAYNAGEGAVAKYGGIPPYAETLNYVVRVARNLKTARQYADQKAKAPAPRVAKPVEGQGEGTVETQPIETVIAADGRVYYKTH